VTLFCVGHRVDSGSGIETQALSINPINAHVLELLNLALEASADAGPLARLGGAGRSEELAEQMRAHAAREARLKAARAKEKEKEKERERGGESTTASSSSSRTMFGEAQEGETGMALG